MKSLTALLARWLAPSMFSSVPRDEEAYLAESGDLADLECRQREWARHADRPTFPPTAL